MSAYLLRRHAAALLMLPLLAACGTATQESVSSAGASVNVAAAPQAPAAAAATPAPDAVATLAASTPASSVPASSAPAPAALVFQVTPGRSTATFRVREQLAGKSLPNDAVGSTSAVTGQLAIQPDGTIDAAASKFTVDLTSLATDQAMRDNYIKFNTLQTRQYPTAQFVPTKAEGLPSPLPMAGQYTFQLTGLLTLHGVQKEVTWDVTASRDGASLTGTATTEFKFEDFGMTPPRAPAVLSVVDDIRLEVNLVAGQS